MLRQPPIEKGEWIAPKVWADVLKMSSRVYEIRSFDLALSLTFITGETDVAKAAGIQADVMVKNFSTQTTLNVHSQH